MTSRSPYQLVRDPDEVDAPDGHGGSRRSDDDQAPVEHDTDTDDTDRAAALIAAGAGRRRLSRELGVTEHEARRLLAQARPTTPDPAGATPRRPTASETTAAAPTTDPTTAGALS